MTMQTAVENPPVEPTPFRERFKQAVLDREFNTAIGLWLDCGEAVEIRRMCPEPQFRNFEALQLVELQEVWCAVREPQGRIKEQFSDEVGTAELAGLLDSMRAIAECVRNKDIFAEVMC